MGEATKRAKRASKGLYVWPKLSGMLSNFSHLAFASGRFMGFTWPGLQGQGFINVKSLSVHRVSMNFKDILHGCLFLMSLWV